MSIRLRSPIAAGALALFVSLAGCGSASDATPALDTGEIASSTTVVASTETTIAPPVASELSMAPAPPSGDLRDVDFLNAMMYVDRGFGGGLANEVPPSLFGPVADGEYVNGEFGEPDFWAFFVNDIAYVDLDGDGIDEVVMSAAINGGGSGYFSELRALGIDGDDIVELDIEYYGDRAFGGIAKVDSADNGRSVLIDVFIDGDGACCGHTVMQQRVGWANDALVVQQDFTPVRYMNLSANSEPPEVKFLPGTSEAQLGLPAGSSREVQFDAQQGQLVTVTDYDGPALADQRLIHLATGDEVLVAGGAILPHDGMYELTLATNDGAGREPFDWTTMVLRIDAVRASS